MWEGWRSVVGGVVCDGMVRCVGVVKVHWWHHHLLPACLMRPGIGRNTPMVCRVHWSGMHACVVISEFVIMLLVFCWRVL